MAKRDYEDFPETDKIITELKAIRNHRKISPEQIRNFKKTGDKSRKSLGNHIGLADRYATLAGQVNSPEEKAELFQQAGSEYELAAIGSENLGEFKEAYKYSKTAERMYKQAAEFEYDEGNLENLNIFQKYSAHNSKLFRERAAIEHLVSKSWWPLNKLVRKRLEQKANIASAIIGICGGLFFLSSNITGNVIGSLTKTFSNSMGVMLFILGLIGAFLYFKKK